MYIIFPLLFSLMIVCFSGYLSSRVRDQRMSPFQGRCCEAVIFHCCGLWYNNTCWICAVR